jgi:proteasome accessory factor B
MTRKLSHAARVLHLRELFDHRPYLTIQGLRQELGVSRRTVYNDLAALEEAGVPLRSEPGAGGEARWTLAPAAHRRTVTLSSGQLLPLGAARQVLTFLDGTTLHAELSGVLERLLEGASGQTRTELGRLEQKLAVVQQGAKRYGEQAEVLDAMLGALLHDEACELWYQPPGQRATRHLVEPLTLLLYREALYLYGRARKREERLIFGVDRIVRCERRPGETFHYPEEHTVDDLLEGCFGLRGGDPIEVEILFDAEQAAYVRERSWHPSQRFEELPDGRMRMSLQVSGDADLLLWLLGHAGSAEVVAPAALRAEVRATLERALRRHR